MKFSSFRSRFRAFQAMRGTDPDRGFIADLEFLENRDLDLSIRIGGMMAFNALLVTIGTHPLSSSTGAPLNIDAATQPALVVASIIGIIPFIASAVMCLRALLLGEEFDSAGLEGEQNLRRSLYAAFVRSIDVQSKLLRQSVFACFVGGVMTLSVWAWILADKML
jgi:hypothetical protein